MSDFYNDTEKFIKDNCRVTVKEAQKSIYLIKTNQRGYDTYDSAIYCGYTKEQVQELSEERMSSYLKYSNTAELIGTASAKLQVSEVISSFNAG